MPDRKVDVRSRLVAVVLPDRDEFTPTQLADMLCVSYKAVFRAVSEGELPPTVQRPGARHVFERETLRQWQIDSAKAEP